MNASELRAFHRQRGLAAMSNQPAIRMAVPRSRPSTVPKLSQLSDAELTQLLAARRSTLQAVGANLPDGGERIKRTIALIEAEQ